MSKRTRIFFFVLSVVVLVMLGLGGLLMQTSATLALLDFGVVTIVAGIGFVVRARILRRDRSSRA